MCTSVTCISVDKMPNLRIEFEFEFVITYHVICFHLLAGRQSVHHHWLFKFNPFKYTYGGVANTDLFLMSLQSFLNHLEKQFGGSVRVLYYNVIKNEMTNDIIKVDDDHKLDILLQTESKNIYLDYTGDSRIDVHVIGFLILKNIVLMIFSMHIYLKFL